MSLAQVKPDASLTSKPVVPEPAQKQAATGGKPLAEGRKVAPMPAIQLDPAWRVIPARALPLGNLRPANRPDYRYFGLVVGRSSDGIQLSLKLTNLSDRDRCLEDLRKHLAAETQVTVAALEAKFGLTQTQKAKLLLAARGDTSRAERYVKNWYEEHGRMRKDVQHQDVMQALASIKELDQTLQACLDDKSSLFFKVLEQLQPDETLSSKDRLLSFVDSVTRAAVLSGEQRDALSSFLERRMPADAVKTVRFCAEQCLIIDDSEFGDILSAGEVAALKRLCHYFLRNSEQP